jgi:hypothetical protein
MADNWGKFNSLPDQSKGQRHKIHNYIRDSVTNYNCFGKSAKIFDKLDVCVVDPCSGVQDSNWSPVILSSECQFLCEFLMVNDTGDRFFIFAKTAWRLMTFMTFLRKIFKQFTTQCHPNGSQKMWFLVNLSTLWFWSPLVVDTRKQKAFKNSANLKIDWNQNTISQSGTWGETDSWRKPVVKNLETLSL